MQATQSSKTVLVVDDDDDLREMVSQMLELEGFTVCAARNGREALDFLRSNPAPSVIVLDLMMPVMSGQEFREEQLRDQALASIPVVLLTAAYDGRGQALAMGAAGYFSKPVEFDAFFAALRACS